ncbi:hypothetical protein PTKIN_Ptkin11bG0051400 [Pterospermum kingtungense]
MTQPAAGTLIPGKGVVICKYPSDPSVVLSYLSFTGGLAATLLLWPTITKQFHLSRNDHHNTTTTCPTVKTGLLDGGAFVSMDSSLSLLVALMLADNARKDHFDEAEKDTKAGNLTDDYHCRYF